jgi:hypothetical protein
VAARAGAGVLARVTSRRVPQPPFFGVGRDIDVDALPAVQRMEEAARLLCRCTPASIKELRAAPRCR